MTPRRIVSFVPAATELIYALGAHDRLCGVTHECTYPEQARALPRISKSAVDYTGMTSAQIDAAVRSSAASPFEIDLEALEQAAPDIIIAQKACSVCAPHADMVCQTLESLDIDPEVFVVDPRGLDDIAGDIVRLAAALGVADAGRDLADSLGRRVQAVRDAPYDDRPSVLVLEWLDPLYTAGHHVPELVQTAGATNLVSAPGGQSRPVELSEVESADPDIIVLAPCGFDLGQTRSEYGALAGSPRWQALRATRQGRIYAVDADSYYSRMGPRTVTGLEIISRIAHPKMTVPAVPDGSYALL